MASIFSETSLVDLLSERAQRDPDRLALRYLLDGERREATYSYGELDRWVRSIAAHIQTHAAPGDRALLLYPDGPEYACAILACLYAGVVGVPYYPPLSAQRQHAERVAMIARDAAPRLVLTEQTLLEPLRLLASSHPQLASCTVLATDAVPLTAGDVWRRPRIAPSSLAFLQYTSGSTSAPKGVMVSHGNVMANERAIARAFGITPDDVVVSWLPLFHDMGLMGTLLQPLFSGIPCVLMAPRHFLMRPERWLQAMSRLRGTVSGAPNFAYRLCAERVAPEQLESLDLSAWRVAFCGAEPVRASTLRAFAEHTAPARFDARALFPCYGLAEATLLVAGGARGRGVRAERFDGAALAEHRVRPLASGQELVGCGTAQPEHEVLIMDPERALPLDQAQVGEIWFAGPSVTQGYFGRADDDGYAMHLGRRYLRTGDLGFQLDGELYVTGRRKDLLIVRGRNLYPQDIERTLEDAVEVLRKGRVAAFAIEAGGEEQIAIAAEVEPRMRRFVDRKALCRSIVQAVAEAHGESPATVFLLRPGALPVTSSGKLQRAACRQACITGAIELLTDRDAPIAVGA